MAFGCASLTVPQAKHQELCSAEERSCIEWQPLSTSELGVKSRARGKAITYTMEKWKEAAHWEHPKIPMYHHPKESKEETAVALSAPQVPFCWAGIQREWWEVLIWIQAVWYPSQQILLWQWSYYQALYTRGFAGVQHVQWEAPRFQKCNLKMCAYSELV